MSRIRADKLVNRAGSGGPEFPYGVAGGLNVAGVVTATSFSGDGSSLTGIDASALKDGSNVKVQATPTGATVTGTLVANDATVQGNLTVNGTTTTIDTVVTAVDSLAVDGQITAGGGINVTGIATATSFVGDGSGLTGVSSWDSYDGWLFGGGC